MKLWTSENRHSNQEEYKRKEAELEKIKDDKLQVEKMLENLKEKVHES